MLRIAKGAAPITIYKADIADPERFRNLMNTLERDKVRLRLCSYYTGSHTRNVHVRSAPCKDKPFYIIAHISSAHLRHARCNINNRSISRVNYYQSHGSINAI